MIPRYGDNRNSHHSDENVSAKHFLAIWNKSEVDPAVNHRGEKVSRNMLPGRMASCRPQVLEPQSSEGTSVDAETMFTDPGSGTVLGATDATIIRQFQNWFFLVRQPCRLAIRL